MDIKTKKEILKDIKSMRELRKEFSKNGKKAFEFLQEIGILDSNGKVREGYQ